MQVTVESPGGLTRKMRVSIPAEQFESAVDKNLQRLAKNARIDGFRPGKVPVKVLRQRYGAQARQDALSDLLEASYPQALREQKLQPAGQPEIEFESMAPGAELTYIAKFDVYPEITVGGIAKMAVTDPEVEVSSSDVDGLLQKLREQRKQFVAKDAAAAEGDRVTIDFVGRIDGEAFEGGSGEDHKLELGAGRFLPDLEAGIVGMAAGEEKIVPLTFPEDYQAEALQGKAAEFTVTVKAVEAAELPAIDADFCRQFGLEEADEEALRGRLRESLEKEAKESVERYRKKQVMENLLAANPIEVPRGLIAQEIERMRHEAAHRFGQGQKAHEELHKMLPDELFAEQAQRRTALGLLIGEIIKTEKLSAEESQVEAKLLEMAGDFEDKDAALNYYRSDQNFMQSLRAMVLEEQVVQYCLDQAKRETVKMDFAELSAKAAD